MYIKYSFFKYIDIDIDIDKQAKELLFSQYYFLVECKFL